MKLKTVVTALVVMAIAAPLLAQRQPRVVSPEVHEDGRVTVRLRAPDAQQVQFSGAHLDGHVDLSKGDGGVWEATIGPLSPGLYDYKLVVDGVANIDPGSPWIKRWSGGSATMLRIPGKKVAFWDVRDVPHGEVAIHHYHSGVVDKTRRVFVYTPPHYNPRQSYPVLYLLHGSGDDEAAWTQVGHANYILDNLIAEGRAEPMLVVMTNGHPIPWGTWNNDNTDKYRRDLVEEVVPLVEGRYRVIEKSAGRAIAGLSMGGGQSLHAGLAHPELFDYVGAFSSAAPDPAASDVVKAYLADPKKSNDAYELLWIAIGEDDFLLDRNTKFQAALDEHGIEHTYKLTAGGHSWDVWREYLWEFAPLLFRD